MPDMEERLTEIETHVRGLSAQMGGIEMELSTIASDLREFRNRLAIQIDNMARNALENRKRIQDIEDRLNGD
ncbi:MAG: hypothetical protein QGG64_29940 [Candidatus Latescibacteria bacterium]|jgi:archaellum component FlaC|nr:hypothetical protein [Candidatus Latescibacterota bacterium]